MKSTLLTPLIFLALLTNAQNQSIQTEIKSENIYDLSIIQIYPDSFPEVSVIFQAKNELGMPLWGIDTSDIGVAENDRNCKVINLKNISTNKPLNIGLVFDHSGSMSVDPSSKIDSFSYFSAEPNDSGAIVFAKQGVRGFLQDTNISTDSIMLVGFSSIVDSIIPLSQNFAGIHRYLDSIQPDGLTAFYDALFVAIDNVSKPSSESVVVALTDGADNQSTNTIETIVELARKKNVAIYTIGLGSVNRTVLEYLSENTEGFFYHTNDPRKLAEIYLHIKKQIKSIYQLDYTSASSDFLETDRNIRFSFLNDTFQFSNPGAAYTLPEETITYLENKERERIKADQNRLIFGSIGILILGLGGFMIYKRVTKPAPINVRVFPNPFITNVSVEYKLPEGRHSGVMELFGRGGKVIYKEDINDSEGTITLDTTRLKRGLYTIKITSEKSVPEVIKVMRK